MGRTYTEITQEIESFIKLRHPEADTSEGSVLRDIIINAPSIVLSFLNSRIDIASRAQSPETAITDREIEGLAKTKGLYRRSGFKARGVVTLICSSSSGPAIPAGTMLATVAPSGEPSRKFLTTQEVAATTWSFAASLNAYTYDIPIEAEEIGSAWVVPAGAISEVLSSIPTITGCFNEASTTTGADRETLISLSNRIRQRDRARGKGTLANYTAFLLSQAGVVDALAIGADDENLLRASNGAVDIFAIGSAPTVVADVYTVIDSVDVILDSRPVLDIASVTGSVSGALTEGVHWQLVPDVLGARSGSTESADKVEWLSPIPNQEITITYSYNSLLVNLQALFLVPDNRVEGANVLVRSAYEIPVDITCSVRILTGYSQGAVTSAISSALTTLFSNYLIGNRVEESEIFAAINNTAGVSSLLSPLTLFQAHDGSLTKDNLGGLAVPSTSYARLGTLVINFV